MEAFLSDGAVSPTGRQCLRFSSKAGSLGNLSSYLCDQHGSWHTASYTVPQKVGLPLQGIGLVSFLKEGTS